MQIVSIGDILMKCQILFSGKNKKTKIDILLSKKGLMNWYMVHVLIQS